MRLGMIDEEGANMKYLKPDPAVEMDIKRHIIFGDIPDDA